jgi:hypothetical protein
MSDPFLDGLLVAGGAILGAHLGQKYLAGFTEQHMVTESVGNTIVSVSQCGYRGRTWFRLYVIEDGEVNTVGQYWHYTEVLAALQVWLRYLTRGGTITAWRIHNAQAGQEIAALEQAYHEER